MIERHIATRTSCFTHGPSIYDCVFWDNTKNCQPWPITILYVAKKDIVEVQCLYGLIFQLHWKRPTPPNPFNFLNFRVKHRPIYKCQCVQSYKEPLSVYCKAHLVVKSSRKVDLVTLQKFTARADETCTLLKYGDQIFFLQKLKQSSMRTSATMSRLEFLNLSGIVISVTESLNLKESMPTTTQSEREYPDPQQHHPHMFALITTATTTSKAVCRVVCLVVFTLKMVIYCPQGSGTLRQQCKVYCILHCIEQCSV